MACLPREHACKYLTNNLLLHFTTEYTMKIRKIFTHCLLALTCGYGAPTLAHAAIPNGTNTASVRGISSSQSQPAAFSNTATVYQDCNFGGYAVGLGVGNYTLAQLTAKKVRDNDLSSLKVNSGYEVVLYENDNFSGRSIILRGQQSCLVDSAFNDKASSLRVRTATPTFAPPQATIFLPQNNMEFAAPDSVTISVRAISPESFGGVAKVEYFSDGTKIGETTTRAASGRYDYVWSNVPLGTHILTAQATSYQGVTGPLSAPVTITMWWAPPKAQIILPDNKAVFTAPASVTISVRAISPESFGSVAKVEYFSNGTKIGETTDRAASGRYDYAWGSVPAGTYALTAQATNFQGFTGPLSAPVSITVKDAVDFTVYANPATNKVYVVSSAKAPITSVQLYSVGGRLSSAAAAGEVNISDLYDGLYFVLVQDAAGNMQKKKVVIQH